MYEKLKERAYALRTALSSGLPLDIFLIVTMILVGTGGFGLGRLSALQNEEQPVRIAYSEEQEGLEISKPSSKNAAASGVLSVSSQQKVVEEGSVVASKNGTKYHLPFCPGADRILETNKIYFASKAEAEKAGYTPAANCKGI